MHSPYLTVIYMPVAALWEALQNLQNNKLLNYQLALHYTQIRIMEFLPFSYPPLIFPYRFRFIMCSAKKSIQQLPVHKTYRSIYQLPSMVFTSTLFLPRAADQLIAESLS